MQTLKKILEEIDAHAIEFEVFGTSDDYISVGWVKDTICKYLSCENNSEITRLSLDNGGWIPVNERLPENERSVLMCGDTGCIDVGWWNGKRWKTGFSHADNFEAVAWRPLPNPYRPASKTPEEMQEWKERMLRNFMRKSER